MISKAKQRRAQQVRRRRSKPLTTGWDERIQRLWPAILAPFLLCGFALKGYSDADKLSGEAALYIRLFFLGVVTIAFAGVVTYCFVMLKLMDQQAPNLSRVLRKFIEAVFFAGMLFMGVMLFKVFGDVIDIAGQLLRASPPPVAGP